MFEILKIAALNTLMGMGTVFLVLIIISLIIYALGVIGRKQNTKIETVASLSEEPVSSNIESCGEINLDEEYELVAVIMAAIAASEDVPADSLVVRSIRRRPSSERWKKA